MIARMAESLRRKETSCAGLAAAALHRAEQTNTRLNAFITVLADRARARAAELDSELARGVDRGPLHGIPVAVKDLIHIRGVRTTAGSRVFENRIADHDAAVVAQLENAGAVIIGKTGLHELAYGITSNNPHYGPVRNPRDTGRIPGGSSGGSGAAVAAGIVPMAVGTDTGGSIRIPASFCGCVGLKPTFGLVSKHGVLPLGFSLDHIGPLSATVDDAAISLDAMIGVSRYRAGHVPDLRGVRIGRPDRFYFDRLAPAVDRAVQGVFDKAASLGAEVVNVPVPDIDQLNAVARVILLAEASAALEPYLARRELFGADVLALLDQGRVLPATWYVQAQRLRSKLVREFDDVWTRADVLIVPATPTTAPFIGAARIDVGGTEEDVRLATTRLVRAVNLLGIPALSVPCGSDERGLPVGMQILGPAFSEASLIRIGTALEPPPPALPQ